MVSEFKPLGKIIVVAGEASREAVYLKRILSYGGKKNIAVADSAAAAPEGPQATVLLLTDRPGPAAHAEKFAVCVMEYSLAQDPRLSGLRNTVTYSVDRNGADFTARNVRLTQDGHAAFEIVGVGIIGRVRLRTGDTAAVPPALAASTAAIAAGVPFAEVLEALNGMNLDDL